VQCPGELCFMFIITHYWNAQYQIVVKAVLSSKGCRFDLLPENFDIGDRYEIRNCLNMCAHYVEKLVRRMVSGQSQKDFIKNMFLWSLKWYGGLRC
jgi:hypothetical protein